MVYAQPRLYTGEWDATTSLWFWDTNGSPNLDQATRPYNNNNHQQQQQKRELAKFWTLLSWCCIAMIQLYVYIYMQKHNQQ